MSAKRKKLHRKNRKIKPKKQFSAKTKSTRFNMWKRQRYRCGICGRQIRHRKLFTMEVNIDHIRPKAHGGHSFPDNLQLVHMVCNQKKADSCHGCEVCYQTNWRSPNGPEASE